MTANTVFLPAPHHVIVAVVVVNIEGALVDAHLTLDAALCITLDQEFGR